MSQKFAERDIRRLAGVSEDETLSDSVRSVTRTRFAWLFVNLLTAILASLVIKRFDTVIEQMVAQPADLRSLMLARALNATRIPSEPLLQERVYDAGALREAIRARGLSAP